MLQIGRDLLRDRDFDQVTVKEIADASQSSVGSFYNSFGDKDKYFTCLIEEMIKRRKAAAYHNFEQPFERLPEFLALGAIQNFNEHQGIIRSALRKHLLGIPAWTPIAKMSREFIDQYRSLCSSHLARSLNSSESLRIAFAFSWLYGMLMQRVMQINDIHQSDIDQEHFARYTVRNFRRLLDDALEPDEER